MHTVSLVDSLDNAHRQKLMQALDQRMPGVPRRNKRRPALLSAAILAMLLLIMFTAAHVFLHHRSPELSLMPGTTASWKGAASAARPPAREFLEDFGFSLPAGVKIVGEMEGSILFEDKVKRIRVKAVANIKRPEITRFARFFRYGMGVRDYYGLLDLTYQSRIGVIPLFLRSLEISGLTNVTVMRVEPPYLRGYIIQGRRGEGEETHLVLVGERSGEEIHFFITGQSRVPEAFVRTIVESTRLVRLPGT